MSAGKKFYFQSMPSMVLGTVQDNRIDASGEKLGVVFQADEDATITHLGLVIRAIVGTTPTYKIGLQGVNASGDPDGTYLGGGTPASATFSPSALGWTATSVRWVALDNSIALTKGTHYAWVIEYSSGTINGTNCAGFGMISGHPQRLRPYWLVHNGTSWAKQSAWNPLWGYKSASNVYGFLTGGSAATQVTVDGRRAAAKFTLPSGFGSTYQLRGFSTIPNAFGAGGTITAGIWSASGVVQSFSVDTDYDGDRNSAAGERDFIFPASLGTLDFGTIYYAGFQRNGTNFWLDAHQLSEANDLKMFAGEGEFTLSTFDGSNWSDDVDAVVPMRLIFEDITEPAGGGGSRGVIIGG